MIRAALASARLRAHREPRESRARCARRGDRRVAARRSSVSHDRRGRAPPGWGGGWGRGPAGGGERERGKDAGPPAGTGVVASDGVGIAGWYIPAASGSGPTGPTVVIVH